MEAYSSFARVYDLFMDDVPYDQWAAHITGLLGEFGIRDGLVLDLGCGTGKMTRLLERAGYDMIGVDSSEEMLEVARNCPNFNSSPREDVAMGGGGSPGEGVAICGGTGSGDGFSDGVSGRQEARDADSRILYLLQDMREFELYGTVRAVVSICDVMNYLLEEEELAQVFALVNNYLDPEGIFIFDLNTVHKYRDVLGESTICENREEGSFLWENYFDEDTGINEYGLTFYIREDVCDGGDLPLPEPTGRGASACGNGNPVKGGDLPLPEPQERGAAGREEKLYRRYEETHYQRAYPLETVKRLLGEAGMEFVAAYDAFTKSPPREDSERLLILAREHGKTGGGS